MENITLASRLKRLFAVLIDTALVIGIVGGIASFNKDLAVIPFLAILVVQLYFISKDGQTLGKKVVKIKIIQKKTLSNGGFVVNVLFRGLINALSFTVIMPIINILFIFTKSRQCIHDKIAGTIVVEE